MKLQYYCDKGTYIVFNKYTIENGIIKNTKGETMAYSKRGKYNVCSVYDDYGKQRPIYVGRAIASSIHGPPPSLQHTADHIDRDYNNDTDDNIRWLCKVGQRNNQVRPESYMSAFIIVKDGIEKTSRDWVEHLRSDKNNFGRNYTISIINHYARQKKHGFAFKEYPNLPKEVWKEIIWSKTKTSHWEISDMNRVKFVTNCADHVFSGKGIGLANGYPIITINGKKWLCHILTFMTFFTEAYANKKPNEYVLHEDDDRLDFRPHKLRLGTKNENGVDAHENGKYDDAKTARTRCVSYINGIFEKEHDSQMDVIRYLKTLGYTKASVSAISMVLNERRKTAYARTYRLI